MAMKDRVCVSRYYPIDHIKPNRMYIVRYCNSLFIANGNIYISHSYDDENNHRKETNVCCTIHNFKKWGGIENLKRFVSLKGKREVKTIADLMDAVMECGYRRELDCFEYRDIEKDSLRENSDYKYGIDELVFHGYEDFISGFQKLESPRYGLQIGRVNDTEMHFCLDLGIGGIRRDLPECILKEIECEVNDLLEVNFVKPEDVKKVKFTCYAKVQLSHNVKKTGEHDFYRSYSIHIGIDSISDYYNDFDLDDLDMKFLKHADFYMCESPEEHKKFNEFIRNEIFS